MDSERRLLRLCIAVLAVIFTILAPASNQAPGGRTYLPGIFHAH